MNQKDCDSLTYLFTLMDKNNDKELSREEFINGMLSIDHLDVTEIEVGRMFDSIDEEKKGKIAAPDFKKAAQRWRWLRSIANIVSTCRQYQFEIPTNYDYTKSTNENYKGPKGLFYGDFIKIREERDYTFHNNYIESRQLWQDMAVKSCLGRTEAQARPWVVYTCGPMGVGKGHVLSWLSKQGLFPLEYIVHIDPDFFKRIMPEWLRYVSAAQENENKEIAAGTLCHAESAYLQEIAMEAAMSERQNVWVDGSLSAGDWYSKVFDDHRKRFPHYRIAIFYITASEATVRARVAKRFRETGRAIPESEIVRSLQSPEESIRLLAPKTDLVVRIVNESSIILKCVEDHSGNWYRGLQKHFGVISHQHPHFPEWLGPLYFENTSLVGNPFDIIRQPREPCHIDERIADYPIKCGHLDKRGLMQQWKTRWFVLRPGRLLYYKSSKLDKTLKGDCLITEHTTINCPNCTEEDEWPAAPKLTKSPSSSFTFLRNSEYNFTINSIRSDGTPVSIIIDAGNDDTRSSWIDAIKNEIENAKKNINAVAGYYQNSHTIIQISNQATYNSPSLRAFLKNCPNFTLILSKLQVIDMERTGREVMGMPEDATHYSWIYPTRLMTSEELDKVNNSDPDIMLLRYGGFVNYDKDGRVIAVRAVSENRTQHVMMFGQPEFLRPEDVERLHAGERWMPVTSQYMIDHGVKYITFILPQEELPSRRFPPAFGFIFREPTEPSDPRDRYFSPVTEY